MRAKKKYRYNYLAHTHKRIYRLITEIATAEKLKKWKYLDKLKPVMSFMRLDDNQEVSLLIAFVLWNQER